MPYNANYSPAELKVFKIIKKHIIESSLTENGILSGGIHIKPKPKNLRLKLIELNSFGTNRARILSKVAMCVNINYQDEDENLVREVTDFICDLFDQSFLSNLYFKSTLKQVGRCSPYLWLGNNCFEVLHKNLNNKIKIYGYTD